jgi:hypothetical protein
MYIVCTGNLCKCFAWRKGFLAKCYHYGKVLYFSLLHGAYAGSFDDIAFKFIPPTGTPQKSFLAHSSTVIEKVVF